VTERSNKPHVRNYSASQLMPHESGASELLGGCFVAAACARGLQRRSRGNCPEPNPSGKHEHAGAPRWAVRITSLRKRSSFQSEQKPAGTGTAG
jgi:hypothetical protein